MNLIFEIDEDELLPDYQWIAFVIRRAGNRCEECGAHKSRRRRLAAHHKDEDNTNHRLSNGQALCDSCHSSVTHKGRDFGENHREAARQNAIAIDLSRMGRESQSFETRSKASTKAWETMRARYGPSGRP